MDIKTYLYKYYQPSSAKTYLREINHFLAVNQAAQNLDYKSVLAYINQQRKHQKPASLHRILQAIKKYYNYLIYIEQREDNPAQNIQIKDYYSKSYFDGKRLLNLEELDLLWTHFLNRKNRYTLLKNRNISMLGLLLHQGLGSGEIKNLKPQNIDLEAGKVLVPKSNRLNSRQLKLNSSQILPFYKYLKEDRPKLINKGVTALFINKLGNKEGGETLHYLLETARPYFKPHKFNPKTIRMSVLARKFKEGLSLLEVQYFAGHQNPSSTERYKSSDLEQLKQSILKYHPLA
ncbi:MAG: site-specific integrase [Aureispira sp.]|nr:site-specific integrase [Aureispira sp.]